MGADFKINEYGEIIRADGTTSNTNKEPQKSSKKLFKFVVLLVLVVIGFLLYNYMCSYIQNQNLNSLDYMPPERIQSSPEVFLNGDIGGSLTVKMYLKYDGDNRYSGWYYYIKNGPNNKLTLYGTADNNILRLDEYNASGERTGTFEGIFDGTSYSGNLYVYRSNKSFNFALYDL